MAGQSLQELRERVAELESLISDRDRDLSIFKSELERVHKEIQFLLKGVNESVSMLEALQSMLNPTDFPNLTGMEVSSKFIPGNVAGSDYFDFFESPESMKVGIILSSCSGFQMSSLIMSLMIQMTMKKTFFDSKSLSHSVRHIREQIIKTLGPNNSLSFFLAILDRKTFELTYYGIGQLLAVVRDGDGEDLEPLKILSVENFRDGDDSIQSIKLNALDQLILLSPGIIEASNKKGSTFGKEGVYGTLSKCQKNSALDLRNELLLKNQLFIDGNEDQRDRTIVVLGVKEKALKLL